MNITTIIPDLLMTVEEYYNNYYVLEDEAYFDDNYVAKISKKGISKEGRIYISNTKKIEDTDLIEFTKKSQENYKILENTIFYFTVIYDETAENSFQVPDVIFSTKNEALNWLKNEF